MSEPAILFTEDEAATPEAAAREAWLGQRKTGLGGSDIAAILGVSGSPFAVWCSKTMESREEDPVPERRLFWGKELERSIAEGYSKLIGEPIEFMGEVLMRHPLHPWWIGSPDGRRLRSPVGFEVKNRGGEQRSKFGREGTDDIPDAIACQVLHYMPLLSWPELGGKVGADYFEVVVLFGGNDHKIYTVRRDPEIEAVIAEKGEHFWNTYVVPKVAPPLDGSEAASWYVKKRFPRNIEGIRTPTEEEFALLVECQKAREESAAAEAEQDRVENLVKAAIGDADGLAFGKKAVTWKKRKDSEKTDMEAVFGDLRATLPPEQLALLSELTQKHTRAVEGVRAFYFPKS